MPVPTTEIACKVVMIKGQSVAIVDGTMEHYMDNRTGETRSREKFFWLPKSQISAIDGVELKEHTDVVLEMPEWLAMDRGLI